MRCVNPGANGVGFYFPCGQCALCRKAKARVWQHRLELEAIVHTENAFITLTYDDQHLPEDGNVSTREMQLFHKKLRFSFNPLRYRHFTVAEYGDRNGRPHYHAILFGYPSCERQMSRFDPDTKSCCRVCDHIRATWGKGHVLVGSVEPRSISYVTSYVLKNLTRKDDRFLHGRHPEFARMSNRPGIGAGAADQIIRDIEAYGDWVYHFTDTPTELGYGARQRRPLGRYLSRRVREGLTGEITAPPERIEAAKARMQALREAAQASEKTITEYLRQILEPYELRANWKPRGTL